MTNMIIRNIDPETLAALKARAATAGRSLQKEVRRIIAEAVSAQKARQEIVTELRATHRRLLKARKGKPFPDSTPMIRKDRLTRR